jgi:hypothetical protein
VGCKDLYSQQPVCCVVLLALLLARVPFIRSFPQLDRDPNATTVKTTCSCSELRQALAKDVQVLPGDDNSVDMSHRKQYVMYPDEPIQTAPDEQIQTVPSRGCIAWFQHNIDTA